MDLICVFLFIIIIKLFLIGVMVVYWYDEWVDTLKDKEV